jgi:hypothetical protein
MGWNTFRHVGRLTVLAWLILGTMWVVHPGARVVDAQHTLAQACSEIGSYAAAHGRSAVGISGGVNQIYPYYGTSVLSGTLTLSAYTGCGVATAGTFALQSVTRQGPLPEQQSRTGQRPSAGGSMAFPLVISTGVLTATGTIAQDPQHAGDPTYVLVNATVTYGRPLPSCIGTCPVPPAIPCQSSGCQARVLVTRTVTFTKVTGYLRVQAGAMPMASLVFLPPPDPRLVGAVATSTLQPVSFLGAHNTP